MWDDRFLTLGGSCGIIFSGYRAKDLNGKETMKNPHRSTRVMMI